MAEIGNIRPSVPVNWPSTPKITPADKQKENDRNKNQQQQNESDENDDHNHIDEYA